MADRLQSNEQALKMARQLFIDRTQNVLIQSPPGGGKTTIALALVSEACRAGRRVAVVAPRLAQVLDFANRLAKSKQMGQAKIQVLLARGRAQPLGSSSDGDMISFIYDTVDIDTGPGVVISTSAKWGAVVASVAQNRFDAAISDEAYQSMFVDIAPLTKLAPCIFYVGDPGQLDPTNIVTSRTFTTGGARMNMPAALELARLTPELRTIQMPLTMRLPQDTVNIISGALYPELAFRSGVKNSDRVVRFSKPSSEPLDGLDRALDLCQGGASIVGILLPQRDMVLSEADRELTQLGVDLINRLLARGVEWSGRRPLGAGDIGYMATHVVSVDAASRAMWRSGLPVDNIMPNTPEVYQGTERPIIVVTHPLTGQSRLTPFDLNRGRWSVMLSRHQLCCFVIARSGIREALTRHRHGGGDRIIGSDDSEWAGWRSHAMIWDQLERSGRLVRA
jgi:hypothetical protein